MQSPHPSLLEQLPQRIVYSSFSPALASLTVRTDDKKLSRLRTITDLQDRAAAMGNLLYPVCKRTKESDRYYVSEEFSTTRYYYLRRNFPKGLFTPENAFDPTMPHSADGRIWFFDIRVEPYITGIKYFIEHDEGLYDRMRLAVLTSESTSTPD